MNNDSACDFLVIGGGMAGMTAAVRASQCGLRARVLERGTGETYLCNTRFTGGTLHVCLDDIMADVGKLRAAIDQVTDGNTPGPLADVMAQDGRRAVRWMQSVGIRFIKASPAAYHNWVLAPPRPLQPGLDWKGRGGDVFLRTMGSQLEKFGGSLTRGARARELIMDGGKCVGVRAEMDGKMGTITAAAVVIADGGFQGNPDLVREYVSPRPDRLKQRGAGTGIGDGLQMARAVGARLTKLDAFYGHVLSRDAMSNEKLWPYPVLDSVVAAAIVVDAAGRRFANEGENGVYFANAIARQQDPFGTCLILDHAIWNTVGRKDLIPANPHVPNLGGKVLQAETLAALAAAAGIDAAALATTVNQYNDAVKQGTTAHLTPSRRADKYKPQPIVQPPYYAIPLCAGITYTMGGIAVDEHGRVLNTAGDVIAGLYAAGSAAGGVDGGPRVGYVGGLSKAAVLGLRSAEHFARAMGNSVS